MMNILRVSSTLQMETTIAQNKKTSKQFLSYVRTKRTDATGIPVLKVDGKDITTGKEKAESLSKQYDSIFTNEDLTNIVYTMPSNPTSTAHEGTNSRCQFNSIQFNSLFQTHLRSIAHTYMSEHKREIQKQHINDS